MVDSKMSSDWNVMALKDRRSAHILFDADGDGEIICFHCQQAVEKVLKGYLVQKTGMLQQGHNLIRLLQKAGDFDVVLLQHIKDIAYLNGFYMETRYPADEPMVLRVDDVQECMSIMERVMEQLTVI